MTGCEETRGAQDLARGAGLGGGGELADVVAGGGTGAGGGSPRSVAFQVWPGADSLLNLTSPERVSLIRSVAPGLQLKGRPDLIGALITQRGYVGRPHYKLLHKEGLRWQSQCR